MGIRDQKKRKRTTASDDESDVKGHESDSHDSPVNSPKAKAKSKSSKSHARNHESDDSSLAETVPTIKKPRTSHSKHNVLRNAEGNGYFVLGKKKRVTVSLFKNKPLIDIREYWGPEDDEKPGKKGIALTVEQWEVMKELVDTIDQLVSDLEK